MIQCNLEILKGQTATKSNSQSDLKKILDKWDSGGRENIIKFCETELSNFNPIIKECSREIPYPIKPEIGIGSINEKAYQRAFLNHADHKTIIGRSLLKTKLQVEWLDMEIPVSRNPKMKFDLIGKANGELLLAELKGNAGDSPFFALFEALSYAKCISINKKMLPYRKVVGNYWQSNGDLKYLVIAGPLTGYWGKPNSGMNYQDEKDNAWWKNHLKLKEIACRLKQKIDFNGEIIFAYFYDEKFEDQVKKAKMTQRIKYTPTYSTNPIIWYELED